MKKSRIGQNFLFDPSIAERIVAAADVSSEDTVVEIGAGHGIMTRILARQAQKVIAVEFDLNLYNKLLNNLDKFQNVNVIHRDVMHYDFTQLGPFKVVANIPYYITTPIIFKLMEEGFNMVTMTLTVQKEVAERIVAAPNNKNYGILSLMVQFYGSTRLLFLIPAGAFTPRPKVDSAAIKIERHVNPPVHLVNHDIFVKIIRASFSGRRKMIANTLKSLYPDIKQLLNAVNIDPSRRPETISMEEFAELSNRIAHMQG